MAATAGSVSIDLDAKMAKFESDMGRAARIMERDLARAARTSQRALADMERQAKAAGAMIGTALAAGATAAAYAIKKTINAMDEMSKSAQRAGLPTEQFSKLAYAASLADVSMQDLQGTLGKLVKNQAAALKGTSEQAKVFASLGIAVTDAEGKLRSAGDVFADFADAFQRQQGSPEIMAAGFQVMGKSFQNIIPLIKDGSAGLRAAGIEAEQLGKVLSTKAGQDAERFNDNLTRLKGAIAGATQEIAIGMLPKLNQMTGDLVAAAKQTENLRQFGDGLATMLGGLGKAFGFVAGMARQFGVDMATAAELGRGWVEMARNVQTLGLADGTVAGGRARMSDALKMRREMLDGMKKSKALAEAEASLARTIAGLKYVDYTGPLLEDSSSKGNAAAAAAVEAERKRLAAALAGSEASARRASGGTRKREMPDFRKEDQDSLRQLVEATARANDEFERMTATLAGPLAEAEHQHRQNLAEITRLGTEAGRAMEETNNLREMETRRYEAQRGAIERALNPMQQLLDAQKEELEMIGVGNGVRAMMNALRERGIALASAEGQAYLRAAAAQEQANAAALRGYSDQIAAMDSLRDSARGFLSDLSKGVGIWDALTNAANKFADTLFEIASKKPIDQILGPSGSTGGGGIGGWLGALLGGGGNSGLSEDQMYSKSVSSGGLTGSSSGGWLNTALGWLGSFFGGGRASGGPVMANTMYEVNENLRSQGPETLSVGGRQFLLMGNQGGQVTPNRGGGRDLHVAQHFYQPVMSDRRTEAQRAQESARKLQMAARNG